MVRTRTLVVGGLIGGLLVSGIALAAAEAPRGGRSAGLMRGGIERAMGALDLTASQRARIQDIRQQHAAEVRQTAQQLRVAQKAQRDAAAAMPADEAAILAAARDAAEVRARTLLLGAQIRDEVWSVLTAEQQERATALVAQQREQLEERRGRLQDRRRAGPRAGR